MGRCLLVGTTRGPGLGFFPAAFLSLPISATMAALTFLNLGSSLSFIPLGLPTGLFALASTFAPPLVSSDDRNLRLDLVDVVLDPAGVGVAGEPHQLRVNASEELHEFHEVVALLQRLGLDLSESVD